MKTEEEVQSKLDLFVTITELWSDGSILEMREFLNETGLKYQFESESEAFMAVMAIVQTLKWVLRK